MKATILTMTSGEGHNRMAKMIAENLRQLGVESDTIDIFAHNKREYNFNNKGYLFVCKYFPKTYNYFWKKLKFRKSEKRYTGIAQREVERAADIVRSKVKYTDFFVCVHPYSAMLFDFWKRQGHFVDKKGFAVLPDILPHPLWESAIQCNYILVPTEHSRAQLKQKGFADEQIVSCGFPVSEKFVEQTDKQQVRKELGLKDMFTVMIVSGGNGIGQNHKVVKKLLHSNVQIVCVNGRNASALKKCQKLAAKNPQCAIANFGFVDNIHQLMSASDVIVTRGGGGSLFEAMNKGLPLIVREKSIINEKENADILQEAGIAINLKKLSDINWAVKQFADNPQKLAEASRRARLFAQGKCAKDVCQTIVQLVEQHN